MRQRLLLIVLIVYAAAALLHHIHNAEFLGEYPGMPAWLSPLGVYSAWLVSTAIGFAGYMALRRGHRRAGLILLVLYGGYGLNVLSHYALAPWGAHTPAMNASIWLEVVTAAALVVVILRREAFGK